MASNRLINVVISATTSPDNSADGDWLIQIVTGTTSGSVVYDAWSAITSCMFATGKTGNNYLTVTVPSTATTYCNVKAIRPYGRGALRTSGINIYKLNTGNTVKTFNCVYSLNQQVLVTRGMLEYFSSNVGNPNAFSHSALTSDEWVQETDNSTEAKRQYEYSSVHALLNNFNVWNGSQYLGPVAMIANIARLWPAWNFKFITPPSDNVVPTDEPSVTTFSFASNVSQMIFCGSSVFPNNTDIVYVTSGSVSLLGNGRHLLSTGVMSPAKQIKRMMCLSTSATLYSASTTNAFVEIEVTCSGTCLNEYSTMSVSDSNGVINGEFWQDIPYDVEEQKFASVVGLSNQGPYLNIGTLTITIDP